MQLSATYRPWLRVAASAGAVIAAYAAYAALAVPMIEPKVGAASTAAVFESTTPMAAVEEQRRRLTAWFKPGDWELESPKILETDQGILLVDRYRTLGEGRMEIKPCTMVFVPSGEFVSEAERDRRAVVLRAPDGAILQFAPGSDLKQARLGKPTGGRLLGPISIYSQQKSPGPEDDLYIETRDVELSNERIMTPHWIDFRFGPHTGRGRQLLAHLVAGGAGELGGLTRLELMHDVEMRLMPGDKDLFPGGERSRPAGPPRPQPPVDVRCQGPFQFDAVRNLATFEENVDVQRLFPDQPADQLTCDLLTIYFNETQAAGAAGESLKLEPARLEARGKPVVIRAPSNNLQARGGYLDYDIIQRLGTLRGTEPVVLRQGEREIRAPELAFQPDESGNYGTFIAVGEGWLRGTSPDDASQQFTANWTRGLHFRPHEGNYVLSLEGDAHVESTGRGALDGEEIHVWLIERLAAEQPPPRPGEPNKPKTELIPDRMLATGNVEIGSPQLTGLVEQLEAWFTVVDVPPASRPVEALPSPQAGMPQAATQMPGGAAALTAGPSLQQPSVAQSAPGAAPPPPAARPLPPAGLYELPAPAPVAVLASQSQPTVDVPMQPTSQPAPAQQFHIDGKLLRMQIAVLGRDMQLREAVIERDVVLRELPHAGDEGKPLLVTGDQVHVVQPQPEQTMISVVGMPANVEARGLTLKGEKIRLDRGRNQLWTEGPGIMTLPVDRDLSGNPLPAAQPLEITWQQGMRFDGLEAHFERDVTARMEFSHLATQVLDASFTERVRFDDLSSDARPQVRSIRCLGGVMLDSRTFEMRQLQSVDHLEAVDLFIEQTTGQLTASGPGVITSVRRGSPQGMLGGGPMVAGPPQGMVQPVGRAAPPDDSQLNYLNVRFGRGLQGNMRSKQMVFDNHVQTLYGPVPTWDAVLDPDRPEQWGEQGMLIHCDRLQVVEQPSTDPSGKSYELEATGNTVVEGQTFTARAARLTYAQAKDLLVLEGDGHGNAQLYRQMRSGAPTSTSSARKILYWPSTNRADVDSAQFLDLNDIPSAP